MSASTQTEHNGKSPAKAKVHAGKPAADMAGWTFRQLTVMPTLLVMAWLLAGLPLLLLRHFTLPLMLLISLPLAGLLVTLEVRWTSGRSQDCSQDRSQELLAARGTESARTPWWSVAALILVAFFFGVDQFVYHSQQIIVQRDPGSYIQFGNWIARHGSLPIPQDAAAFGAYHHGLSFNTAAFYEVGHSIVPQFMAGLPMTLAAVFWVGGVSAATVTGALLGSCGVLAVGGLTGRLVGPRWAPLGALTMALALPEQFTSRSTYSEPLVQVLFLGGLCLLVDALTPETAARRQVAALAGLAIGLTLLVRIDGASDMLPLVPYCGLLALGRRQQAWPLIGGVIVGSAYGAIDGIFLSRPYLGEIKGSLLPLVFAGAGLTLVTGITILLLWRRGVPELRTNWLPNAAAGLAFIVTIGLVIRPYIQTVHGYVDAKQAVSMARLQAAQHLPIQPTRLYYENSLHWVFWYIGVPAVVLATVGAAVLARRCLRGRAPAWTLPLMSFAWIIVATLLRPSIIPDQPWASRRLVPGVLPGFIVLALWAASWLLGWIRQRGAGRIVQGIAVALLAAAMIIPAASTTFDLVYRDNGPRGPRIVPIGLARRVTFRGEITAVRKLCAAIPANASVLILNGGTAGEVAQVIRGMCGEPAALVEYPHRKRVLALVADIQRAGRRPVLIARFAAGLVKYGSQPQLVMDLHSRADVHELVQPPLKTVNMTIKIWMLELPK